MTGIIKIPLLYNFNYSLNIELRKLSVEKDIFVFTVTGDIVGKQRAKVYSRIVNHKIITRGVTPKNTREYEKLIRTQYKLQKKKNFNFIKSSPFAIVLNCYLKVPNSIAKWKIPFFENRICT